MLCATGRYATVSASSISDAAVVPQDDTPPRRAWAWVLGAVALGLVLLRLMAPLVLAPLIESRLERALGAEAVVADVDLSLLGAALTVHGIDARPTDAGSQSHVRVDAFTVRANLRDLMRGDPYLHASASGVELTLDTSRPWPLPDRSDEDGSIASSVRSLELERGRLAVILASGSPPVDVLSDIRASIVDSSTGRRTTALSTHVTLAATAGDAGSLAIDGVVAPVASASNWSATFELERLDLRPFNPLFQSFFEMDLEHGWLSAQGELNVGLGRLRGQILPQFEDLQLLGRGETRVRHPMAEALFSTMLASADIPIVLDQPDPFDGEVAVGEVEKPKPKELLESIILRGFTRRLDTLDDLESTAERLEVNFPEGRLSFYGVTLTKRGGGVDTPFVSVRRLDIVVEQSAVDDDIATYKAIKLFEPSLVFVTGRNAETSQLRFDPRWQEKVSVLPYPTDRIDIIGGKVEYRDDTTDPPTSLYASDIELRVDNLGRARVETVRRAATLVASARVMDISDLKVEAEMSPGALPIDATVRLNLDPLPLRELNDLLRARLQIDVTGGTLAVVAELDAYEGRVHGTVTPALPGIAVIGSDEVEFQRPIREFMLERRVRKLDGKQLNIDYRVQESLLRELPGALLFAAMHSD
jgi:hypothetical protein